MRVVQVFKDYEPPVFGGVERTVRLLSEGLSARPGVEVTVLCSSNRPWTRVEHVGSVRVVRLATFGRIARAPVSPSIPFWLRRLEPDIVHLHHPNPTGELACLIARPRCPIVMTYHTDIVRQKALFSLYRRPLRRLLNRVDRILVTSDAMLAQSETLAPHRARCEVLPLGIRVSGLAETERSRETTARLRSAHPGPIVLFVGRMRPYKGLHVLVDAMAQVPGTLVLVGRGEMEEPLRAKIRRDRLERRVVLAGDVPEAELAGYYRAADVFALPSIDRSEALGLAMIEAMHCGVPVVSTRLGTGTSHVNLDGVTGWEAAPRDAADLARAINRILGDPASAARMREAGRERARMFSEAAMVERTARLYEGLIQAR
jgi:rhamnosyl/mannosyltransferase